MRILWWGLTGCRPFPKIIQRRAERWVVVRTIAIGYKWALITALNLLRKQVINLLLQPLDFIRYWRNDYLING